MNAAYKLKQSPKISEKPILFAKFTVNMRKPVIIRDNANLSQGHSRGVGIARKSWERLARILWRHFGHSSLFSHRSIKMCLQRSKGVKKFRLLSIPQDRTPWRIPLRLCKWTSATNRRDLWNLTLQTYSIKTDSTSSYILPQRILFCHMSCLFQRLRISVLLLFEGSMNV